MWSPRGSLALTAAALIAAVLVPVPGRAQGGKPVEITKPADPLVAARWQLEGRWDLISYEIFPPGKGKIELKGKGTMIYDDFGNLEMNIRVDDRTARALDEVGIPTTKGELMTKGRTVIDVKNSSLVFVLEGQPAFGAPSGPLALNKRRYWQLEGDVLTLTTRDDAGKPQSIGKWQKMVAQ
jgi:hypothetical protein